MAASAATLPTGIDFSFAGYGGGGVALPAPAATLLVNPTGKDDTRMLQAAIDKVATMAPGADGMRGVVLLAPGKFQIEGQLHITAGGIVLRGSGAEATTLLATGVDRRTIVNVGAVKRPQLGEPVKVTADAPAGATVLTLADVGGLAAGDRMVITRPCTDPWIIDLKMNAFSGPTIGDYAPQRITWLPGSREVTWDRQIVAVDAAKKQITLDVPITTALETRYGLGTTAKVTGNAPIAQVGIEALTLESQVDPAQPKDENHSWIALAIDNTEDAWVRNVTARHFAASGVRVGPRARRVTVEACRVEAPVSEIAGWRRANFRVEGQEVLVRDCYAEAGVDDFATGLCAGGPDVFLDCQTKDSVGASGSIESWSSGMLYERVKVDGADLRLTYDMDRTQGGGWTAANSVIWNCTAKAIEAQGPEGAANMVSDSKEPLYETLLKARGKALPAEAAPSADAGKATAFQWQDTPEAPAPIHAVKVVGGRYVIDDHVLWGSQMVDALWQGQATPTGSARIGSQQIARYVPGREGPGFTENLPELSQRMVSQGVAFYFAFPGLWYDRRRDAHTKIPRPDGNVWAPFLEQPWGRSGQGTAYDGLSLYDVSTYNPWYFSRVKEFAQLSAQNGTVLYHSLYDTHNVLEIIPHYEDFPFRPINNINKDGMPEPPLMDDLSGSRFHMGNQFYDPSNPVLRELHRKFIMHELDELGDQPNLIFSTAYQFVGPLSFQQFFQQTIAEWEKAHNKTVKVALMTTKDITDAILEDRDLSKQVVAIDLHYWQYRPEGDLWAPEGGRNFAFRAMVRETWPQYQDNAAPTTPEQAYRQIREYKDKYPNLAIISPGNDAAPLVPLIAGAAASSGGGTKAADAWVNKELGSVLMNMTPQDRVVTGSGGPAWCLGDEKMSHVLIYSPYGASMSLYVDLPAPGYTAMWVNPATGESQPMSLPVGRGGAGRGAAARGGPPPSPWIKTAVINKPDAGAWLLYLRANG